MIPDTVAFNLLLAYSEWLDADQHIIGAAEHNSDERTHTDLVTDFVFTLDPLSPIGILVIHPARWMTAMGEQ